MIMMDVRRLHDNCDNSTECRKKNILNRLKKGSKSDGVGGDNDAQSANLLEMVAMAMVFLTDFRTISFFL